MIISLFYTSKRRDTISVIQKNSIISIMRNSWLPDYQKASVPHSVKGVSYLNRRCRCMYRNLVTIEKCLSILGQDISTGIV